MQEVRTYRLQQVFMAAMGEMRLQCRRKELWMEQPERHSRSSVGQRPGQEMHEKRRAYGAAGPWENAGAVRRRRRI